MRSDIEYNREIFDAIIKPDFELAKQLFEKNPEQFEAYTPFAGGTWLHFVAGEGSLELVKYLLEQGIDINEGDKRDDRKALSSACAAAKYEVAEYLLDHGAKMDTSKSVRNPLFACISAYTSPRNRQKPKELFYDIAKLLLDRGIDSTVRYVDTWDDLDAMGFAEMWGRQDIARLIAELQADGDEEKIEALLMQAREGGKRNSGPLSDEG